eukprot:TRINITY_DN28407_c1_g1_i1.p7 TRINITY_DN28407_c1_g1~~TRINITY_DN28407_c1_g1_i1.p7  ORF type:complete len:107 (-),score=9.73 TRINITY_DN28407_c1_g1_i1:1078-1398(-)
MQERVVVPQVILEVVVKVGGKDVVEELVGVVEDGVEDGVEIGEEVEGAGMGVDNHKPQTKAIELIKFDLQFNIVRIAQITQYLINYSKQLHLIVSIVTSIYIIAII